MRPGLQRKSAPAGLAIIGMIVCAVNGAELSHRNWSGKPGFFAFGIACNPWGLQSNPRGKKMCRNDQFDRKKVSAAAQQFSV
jgi:hypothetical protein